MLFALIVALIAPIGFDVAPSVAAGSAGTMRSVIVVLKPNRGAASVASVAASAHAIPVHTYSAVFNGFAAELPEPAIQALARNPNVAAITDDGVAAITEQAVPTGLKRIGGPSASVAASDGSLSSVDADIAILDTGVDPNHPDLNVVGGKACVTGNSSWADDHGHGTKVAGVAAARDNGIGVVGVAPGARIWSIKVADSNGNARWSDMICGIDWVAANAATIDVANMSITGGGSDGGCTTSSLQQSVCALVNNGVPLIVAAGNQGQNAASYVPAAFDEAITVGAIVDTDGGPGGRGPASGSGPDDAVASFSNFGADLDLSAPGVSVLTTTRGGGTGMGTGTSFSAPYATGAAALYLAAHPGASPEQVRSALISAAAAQTGPNGFTGDRDGTAEPLLWLEAPQAARTPTPTPTPTASPTRTPTATAVNSPTEVPSATATPVIGDPIASPTTETPVGDAPQPTAPAGEWPTEPTASNPIPAISLSKQKSKYNGRIIVLMSGFAPNQVVSVRWQDGTILANASTDATGAARAEFRTPLVPYGGYRVIGMDQAEHRAETRLSVISRIKTTASSGVAGSTIRVYLYGYRPGERVEVRWSIATGGSYRVLKTLTIADNGRASSLITIPAGATADRYKLIGKVIGVSRSASAAFLVTAITTSEQTPPTPSPTPSVDATGTPTVTATPVIESTPLRDDPPTPELSATPEPTLPAEIVPTGTPPTPQESPTEEMPGDPDDGPGTPTG